MTRSKRTPRRIVQLLALSILAAAVVVPLRPAAAGNDKDHEGDDGPGYSIYGDQGYYYEPGPSYYAPPPAYYYPPPPQSYYVPPAFGFTVTVPLRHD